MSEQIKVKPLMTEDEIQVLRQINDAAAPYGQRVQALLAVAMGQSHEEAAEISGLRPTQVRYWVARYQKMGTACFPASFFTEKGDKVEMAQIEEQVKETAVITEDPPTKKKAKKQKAKKSGKKKDKKAKGVKKSKKAKKEKKEKKAKKGSKQSKKDQDSKKKKKKKKSGKKKASSKKK